VTWSWPDTVIVADDGLATELEEQGHNLSDELWSARLLADAPDAIRAAHLAYFQLGQILFWWLSALEAPNMVAEEQAVPADARHGPGRRLPRLLRGRLRTAGKRRALTGLAVVVAVAIVYCCALREASTVVTTSDGASFAVQGRAMTHGNLLLRGWRLADVSFYPIDLLVYAAGVLILGLRPDVVPACAAAIFTILVVLACAAARGQSRGLAGLAAVLLTAAVMAGPSIRVAGVLLTTPDHTGTAVVPLVLALVIDRAKRGWRAGVLVCAVLACGLLADSLVFLVGVIPVVVVCLARAWRDRSGRGEVFLAGGAVAAVAVFTVLKAVIRLLGGWQLDGNGHQIVAGQDLAGNLGGTLQDVLNLFSASPLGRAANPGLILTAIHLGLFSLVAVAGWIALRRLFWRGDLVAVLLAVGIVANTAVYTLLYVTGPATGQDVAPVFGMGAALAGRVLGGPLARSWPGRGRGTLDRGTRRDEPGAATGVARGAWPLLAAWAVVVLAVAVPPLVTARPAAPANAALASWLADHGLHSGIAQYWQANSVTLDSGGVVTMRDVWDYGRDGGIRPYPWEENTRLLDPRRNYANFVIAAAHSGLTRPAIERRFGPPARVYQVGTFTVLVYGRNLMPEIAGLPAPWPAPVGF
jgi:hypothetical protein